MKEENHPCAQAGYIDLLTPSVFHGVLKNTLDLSGESVLKYLFYERNTNFYTYNISLWPQNISIRDGFGKSQHITASVD